jgi:hypothetical protein
MNLHAMCAADSDVELAGSEVPVDSAISHCEKLRRVLELEEWIKDASADPLLAAPRRTWELEHEQLLRELNLAH